MEKFFLKKYVNKTNNELQYIVDNKHLFDKYAVNAAIETLNLRLDASIPKLEIPKPKNTNLDKDENFKWINLRPFLTSLSYQNFLTYFTLSIFLLSFWEILDYYEGEEYINSYASYLRFLGFVICLLLSHIFYKAEYGKHRSLPARIFSTILFTILFIFLDRTYNYLIYEEYYKSVNIDALTIILLLVLIFLFELTISFLRFILKLMKWHLF